MSAPRRNSTVSVVIPTSGQRTFLEAAIRSVLVQRETDVSVCVVADGPEARAGCVGQVVESRHVRLLSLPERKGASAARNLGLRASDSDYVFFLDDDDLVHPTMLRACIDTLEAAGASLGVCATVTFDSDLEAIGAALYRPPPDHHLERFLRHDVAWVSCACVYRRDAPGLDEGWWEQLPKNQDFHMHAKCLAMGARAGITPRILAYWRQHGGARLSVAPSTVDSISGFDILEDLRARLESRDRLDGANRHALALGYLKYMAMLGSCGEIERCRKGRRRVAELLGDAKLSELLRLRLYESACRWRPSAAWRLLHGTRFNAFEGLDRREMTESDCEESRCGLAETLAAIAAEPPQ